MVQKKINDDDAIKKNLEMFRSRLVVIEIKTTLLYKKRRQSVNKQF